MPTKEVDFIETYSGRKFYPLAPRAEDVCIEDIAHALSLICRYNGHCSWFYSVGQHSVLVSKLVPPEFWLDGLLHDAAEAYLGDLPRPTKQSIPEFKPVEQRVHEAVAEKFGIAPIIPLAIKHYDSAILATEAKALGMNQRDDWYLPVKAADVEIRFMNPFAVEREFLKRFKELTKGNKNGHI